MTSGSYTIGGTSPDYATVTAWEADITGNLTGIVEGKIRAGEIVGAFVLDANGHTVTASNYMRLTYDTGAYHAGDLWAGVEMRGAQPNTDDEHIILIGADYTRIVGLNFNRYHGVSGEAIRVDATMCRIEYCLFWGAGNINADGIFLGNGNHFTSTSTTDKLFVSNCFFGWLGRTAIHVQGDKCGTVYVYNCTGIGLGYGNQNAQDNIPRAYVGMGDDLGDGPVTNPINWQIKNTFVHCEPDGNGDACPAFGKSATSNWTNCNNNASSDTTAPGTSAQTSVALASQFEQGPTEITVGENSADDYGGAWADTELQAANPTTNYGSDSIESVSGGASPVNLLVRADLTNVPSTTRVIAAQLAIKKFGAENGNFTVAAKQLVRAWVESEATYNIWSTGNNWTTAGAVGSGDVDTYGAEGEAVGVTKRCAGCEISPVTGGGHIVDGEWFAWSGGQFTEWMQDAIDGASPASDPDWLDLLWQYFNGDTAGDAFHCSESTDGSRPYWRIWYDTAASPLNVMPVTGGVLDGNGANVGSDSDYPIGTTDLYGATRDSSWDIGAVAFAPAQSLTGTLVTQAGVGYDGVLSSVATLTPDSYVDQMAFGIDASIKGADFLPPVIDYFNKWEGTYKDIDEEPASDTDFIASPAAPNPVVLLSEGWESGSPGWRHTLSSVVNPGDAYEGDYVLRTVSSGTAEVWYDQPNPDWPVDPDALYRLSFAARRPTGTAGRLYACIQTKEENGYPILPWSQAVFQHSLTWLTVATSPSDTSITVADATHWEDQSQAACIIFDALPDMSDIEFKGGHHPGREFGNLSNVTYRDIAAGGITGNVITLAGGQTVGASHPVGTWVRCHRHTGTYMYPVAFELVPATWTVYSKLFGGMRSLVDRFFSPDPSAAIERYDGDMFRLGSDSFTVGFLVNLEATDSNTLDLDAIKIERLDNCVLKRVAITQETGIDGSDHVRYRVRKDIAVGTVNVKVSLLQKGADGDLVYYKWGFTEIESWQHNNVGTGWTDYKQTITNDSLITNRSQLYLFFEATTG